MTTTTTELTGGADDRRPAPARGGRRGGGGGLGSYLLIRFLLIIPTIFILVTIVFFLMRTTGDPITAALGGRLPADQLAERIHEAGYDRPILVQYFEYLGDICARRLRHDAHRQPAGRRGAHHLRRRDPRARLLRADRRLPRRHPARPGSPPTTATSGPDAGLRVFAILCYATPVFFAGLLLKLVFSVWLGWLPVAGRASTGAEIAAADAAEPDRHLPDRRDPARRPRGRSATCSQHAVLPALTLGLLTAGIFLRLVRTNVIGTLGIGLRRGGPLARRAASAGCCASTPTGRR